MSIDPVLDSVSIRPGRREDFPLLQGIERDAAVLFASIPELPEIPDDVTLVHDLEEALRQNSLWVAEMAKEIAGYAFALPVDANLHLEEISVSRKFGRRGIGRTLVNEVLNHARNAGYPAVTLTTFRDVPWNAPFYRSVGFEVLNASELTPELQDAVEDEGRRGLPIELRVAMIYRFGAP